MASHFSLTRICDKKIEKLIVILCDFYAYRSFFFSFFPFASNKKLSMSGFSLLLSVSAFISLIIGTCWHRVCLLVENIEQRKRVKDKRRNFILLIWWNVDLISLSIKFQNFCHWLTIEHKHNDSELLPLTIYLFYFFAVD